eukprot:4400145-Amphidinium_carterae.1
MVARHIRGVSNIEADLLSRGTVPVTLQTAQRVAAPDRAVVFRAWPQQKFNSSVLPLSLDVRLLECVVQCLVAGAHCCPHLS